jgi:Zn/Cd-binding protein ZinT
LTAGKTAKETTLKKKHGVFFDFVVLMTAAIFTLAGCDNSNSGDNNEPELAAWAGTWNPVHDYLDNSGLDASFQAAYNALLDAAKEVYTSVQALRDMTKELAVTDIGSFVIQGDKIIFYDQKQTQKNPSGNVIETVTYAFKGIR